MIREEPELLTDIRDFTSLFYVIFRRSPPNGQSRLSKATYVPVNSKTAHPPPGQTPGHLTFLKNFGQIPGYVASLDGQMPHPLELQRGSNPPTLQAVYS